MKITLIDTNRGGADTIVTALSVCRNKPCSHKTIDTALTAKPVPHLAALEFAWACFKLEGVSIKAMRQLMRHRHFSFMEASTRSIDFSLSDYVVPTSALYPNEFISAYETALGLYDGALLDEEKLEDTAYMLPLGTATTVFLAGNLRTFYEYFQKRLCHKHTQDESYRLAKELLRQLATPYPFMMYSIPCSNCGVCASNARQQEG